MAKSYLSVRSPTSLSRLPSLQGVQSLLSTIMGQGGFRCTLAGTGSPERGVIWFASPVWSTSSPFLVLDRLAVPRSGAVTVVFGLAFVRSASLGSATLGDRSERVTRSDSTTRIKHGGYRRRKQRSRMNAAQHFSSSDGRPSPVCVQSCPKHVHRSGEVLDLCVGRKLLTALSTAAKRAIKGANCSSRDCDKSSSRATAERHRILYAQFLCFSSKANRLQCWLCTGRRVHS